MTIISRYILREFNKIFFYGLLFMASIFFIIDLFEHLDTFIKYQTNLFSIIHYFILKLPFIILTIAPIAILLATFITLGIFSRNLEIVALKATGISLFRLVVPIVAYALIVSILSLLGNELVAPYTNRKVKAIYNEIKGRKEKYLFKQNQIWYHAENRMYNIKLFSHRNNILHGITIYFFDPDFTLLKRIDADQARWINNQWAFFNVTTRVFSPEQKIKTSFEKRTIIPLKETPETFKREIREPEEMSYVELKKYIEKTIQEGYDTTQYFTDLHAKGSRPFISFVIALLGVPFAIRIGKRGGFALGVTVSFALGFLYWIFFNICIAMGYSGAFHPFISAWVANFIFGILGLWMLLQIRF